MSTHSLSWSRSTLTMYKESTRDDSNFAIGVNFVLIHLELSLIICNSKTITRIRGTFTECCQVYIHNDYWPATPLIHPYLYASSHNILYILRYQNRQKYQFTELICPWDNQIVWHSIWHGIILKRLQSSFCVASNTMADWGHDNQMKNAVNHKKIRSEIFRPLSCSSCAQGQSEL